MTRAQKEAILRHIADSVAVGISDGGEIDDVFEAAPGLDEEEASEALVEFRCEAVALVRDLLRLPG